MEAMVNRAFGAIAELAQVIPDKAWQFGTSYLRPLPIR
jgi:hypothetical protein